MKKLIIKGAQALCRPGKEGVHLVWVMEERACCRKAAKEGTELLIENSSTEKSRGELKRQADDFQIIYRQWVLYERLASFVPLLLCSFFLAL